jgi:ribosome recycling factor
MDELCQLCYDEAKKGMESSLDHLNKELLKVRAGKATPQMLDGVRIDYYGTITPLSQLSNINTPDPRTIVIQPWDRSVLAAIEKAIMAANLGFNPQNTGDVIRISVPPLTEERRREMVKKAKAEGEHAKVGIRAIRKNANTEAKDLEKEGVPEDDIKKLEKDIQDLTDSYITKVDKILDAKEKDIMTV